MGSEQPVKKRQKTSDEKEDNAIVSLQRQLVNNEKFSDVVLVVGQKRFHGHRLLLANASNVFEQMLTNPSWVDSDKSELVLLEDDECCEVFDHFLRYVYTGDVMSSLTPENVCSVHVLADKYNVTDLKDSCTVYMKNQLGGSVDPCHAAVWYKFAQTYSNLTLQQACLDYIVWNADVFIKSPQWIGLDLDAMVAFLSRSDMIISAEYVLLKAVVQWLIDDSRMSELCANLVPVLQHIRFTTIFPTDLALFEKSLECASPAFRSKYVQDIFAKHLYLGYRYHALNQSNHHIDTRLGFNDNASISTKSADDGTPIVYTDRNYNDDRYLVHTRLNLLGLPCFGTVVNRFRRSVFRHTTPSRRFLALCEVELEVRPTPDVLALGRSLPNQSYTTYSSTNTGTYETKVVLRYSGKLTLKRVAITLAARSHGNSLSYNKFVTTVERTFLFDHIRRDYAINPVRLEVLCDSRSSGLSFNVFLRPLTAIETDVNVGSTL